MLTEIFYLWILFCDFSGRFTGVNSSNIFIVDYVRLKVLERGLTISRIPKLEAIIKNS